MLVGKVLAEAAMREGKFLTWLPAYGPEVRGGTAHCMITISDMEIGSPYIKKAGIVIAMNQPSLNRFLDKTIQGGFLIYNSSLVSAQARLVSGKINKKRLKIIGHPFTDIALRLGNIKVANMIALGCLMRHKNIVGFKTVIRAMEEIAPADKRELLEINHSALKEGMGLA